MNTRTVARIVGGCIIIVLLGIVAGAGLLLVGMPAVGAQLPPGSAPLKVDLVSPENDASLPSGAYVSVRAEALGANPMSAIQFWVDGVPVNAAGAGDGVVTHTLDGNWAWLPASDGAHILVARAVDYLGNAAVSNPVTVDVTAQSGASAPPGVAGKGASGFSGSQSTSTEPPAGLPAAPPLPGPGQSAPAPSGGVNPAPVWFAIHFPILTGLTTLPTAPQLAAAATGCNVSLYIYDKSNNENGFFLYRMGPSDSSFSRIATIAPNSGPSALAYTDSALTGTQQYYASSFNAAGESSGNIVQSVVTDPTCISAAPSGPQLSNPKMTTAQPMDKVYCYMTFNSNTWIRIPAGMNSFVFPNSQGEADFGPYLGPLSTTALTKDALLQFECWGWSGGLQGLGQAETIIKPGQSGLVTIKGPKFQLIANLLGQPPVIPLGGTPPPPPPPSSDKIIAPPANVQGTLDVSICTKHSAIPFIFALLCDQAVKTGDVITVWSWPPIGCFPGAACSYEQIIDGYRVYNSWNGALVDTLTSQKQTVSILPFKLENPLFPPCYFVEAFKGAKHSEPSSIACPMPKPAPKTVTLQPKQRVTSAWWNGSYTGASNCGTADVSDLYPDGSILKAGYENQPNPTNCADFFYSLYLGRAGFDVWAAGISSDQLLDATLHTLANNEVADTFNTGNEPVINCGWTIGRMKGWNGYTDGHENLKYDFYFTLPNLPAVDVPVTSVVKQWLQSKKPPNLLIYPSFLFVPPNYGVGDPGSCIADYTVSLELKYQP